MRFAHLYGALFGWRVQSGPFRGLRYIDESICSTLAPKILGTYERELVPWIEALLREPFDLVINVGAAEGYYAVGFAQRGRAPVLAFEAEAAGRELIAKLAARNGVSKRMEIAGSCNPAALNARLTTANRPFVVMDVEGYEATLLDLATVPALRHAVILVELHEGAEPVAGILEARFRASHDIIESRARPRIWSDLPWCVRLAGRAAPARFMAAMDEHRPIGMRWWLLHPHPEP
ncbi:MAG: hypothetical protein PHE83_15815 [Opitutaceae bacterium]|nr:hypothetical protein [Opitutaceae bacterium]